MRVHVLTLAAAIVLPAPPVAAQADAQPELNEWTVPYAESRPRDPMVGPDGDVWFVGQRSDYVAMLDPETGEFRRYDLEEGAGPHNLVVAEDGMIWYTGNRASHLGRLDPETGEIEKFMMPDPDIRDPHTLITDSKGDLWFTAQSGNVVGKFWKETGEIRLVQAPEVSDSRRGGGSSRPYGIVMDSKDHPWIVLFNTNKVATVDPETFEMSTFDLPNADARPRRIGITSDDIVWYVDYARGYLGRLDPETGAVREWLMPSGEGSRPYGMAVDDSDRIWFVETGVQPNMFVGFDPMTEEFIDGVPLESGGGTVRHMYFDPETNSVWFGADTNTIGVAKLPPPEARRLVLMRAYRVALAAALTLVGAAAAVPATNIDGPPPGHTGGFGEPTCLLCHIGANLNDHGGRVSIHGLPDRYEAGASYLLTILLEAEETEAAGFQLSVRYRAGAERGRTAGELTTLDGRVSVKRGETGLLYAQHTREGIRTPDPNGATWTVRWTAPNDGGPVALNVAANSANGDDSPLSDLVYTAEVVVPPAR